MAEGDEQWWFYDAVTDEVFTGALDRQGRVWVPGRETPTPLPQPNLFLVEPIEVPHG